MFKRFNWLSRAYEPDRVALETWDHEYRAGRWQRLASLGELGHYSVIAGYCTYNGSDKSILDMGCGDGQLAVRLDSRYRLYVGVDISSEAIQRARRLADSRTRFRVGTAEQYTPNEHFDMVVFNELLYYMDEPLELMKRYLNWLNIDGMMIVSMFRQRRSEKVWNMIDDHFRCVDLVTVTHGGSRLSWDIRLLRSDGPDAANAR